MTPRNLALLAAVPASLVAYLLAWPVPIDAEAWTAPPAPNDTGLLAPNGALDDLRRVELPDGHGPEDVEVDALGRVYVGLHDGRILRFTGEQVDLFADTGGRPLGLHWDLEGNLLVADAHKGLLSIDPEGLVTTLVTQVEGQALIFTDDLDMSAQGIVYFTDASVDFAQPDWKLDLVQNRPRGRLLAYDLRSGRSWEVLDGLYFANGVAVDPEGQFLLVNETSRYRVTKVWLTGSRKGEHEVLIDNLPGFPDGISTGTDGVYWLAIASPRSAILDATAAYPFLRHIIVRLPDALQPAPQQTTRTLGLRADGSIAHHLYDPNGTHLAVTTSVQERGGRLYFGSLTDTAWAWIDRP